MISEYEGSDLEAMSFAENYHRWIVGDIRPYLGGRLLEVGAGTGSFSRLLLETGPELLVAIEPSKTMFAALQTAIGPLAAGSQVQLHNGSIQAVGQDIGEGTFDSVIYVNVLEHIEDDQSELAAARTLLHSGGNLIVYVPALPALFGPFDRRVGHHRRYTAEQLVLVAENAGFRLVSVGYRDLMGVVPWWVQARILKSASLKPWSVRLYDKMIPFVRLIDRLSGPPVGKNLLLIAQAID